MSATDVAVVAQVRAGDADAYRLLVERYSRSVFRLAYRMMGNEQDAEDVVQETFLRAYQNLHRFDMLASFSTWLYRIAANYSLDLLRQRKRQQPTSEEWDADQFAAGDPQPDRMLLSQQVQEHLTAALARLTPQERTSFVLRHFEGQSIEEIGRMLGSSENATKQSVFRAVKKLRKALAPFVQAAGR